MDGGDGKRVKRKIRFFMLMNGGDESELQGGTGAIDYFVHNHINF